MIRGQFSDANSRQQAIGGVKPAGWGGFFEDLACHFYCRIQTIFKNFLFQKFFSQAQTSCTLFGIYIVGYPTTRFRGFNKGQPIAAGRYILGCDDFHLVSISQFITQRDHLSIHLCGLAAVSYVCMNLERKVNRGGIVWQSDHVSSRGKYINRIRKQVHLKGVEKFFWVF